MAMSKLSFIKTSQAQFGFMYRSKDKIKTQIMVLNDIHIVNG